MSFELDMDGIMGILGQREGVDALTSRARDAVRTARETGPRGKHAGRHEVDKIDVGETHVTRDGAVVDIDWRSSVWHLIEYGSVHNPPYAPIRNSAKSAGLQVIDERGA